MIIIVIINDIDKFNLYIIDINNLTSEERTLIL